MHGLLRAFAIERLRHIRPGDRAETALRYLRSLLKLSTIADEARDVVLPEAEGLADRGGPTLPNAEAAAAAGTDWFDDEAAGIRVAIGSALGAGRLDLAAGLALRITSYLHVRDDREVKLGMLSKVRDAMVDTPWLDLRARIELAFCTAVANDGGSGHELGAVAERALAAASEIGSPSFKVSALHYVGHAAHRDCDFGRALRANEQVLEIIDAHPELDNERAITLGNIGSVLRDRGELTRAVSMMRNACKAHSGDVRTHAIMLVNLASALADIDAVDELSDVLTEVQRLVTGLGDPLGRAHVLVRTARLAVRQGDRERVHSSLEAAEELFAEHPDVTGTLDIYLARAEAQLADGRVASARRILAAAIEVADGVGYVLGVHRFRTLLASGKYRGNDDPL